MCVTVCRLVFWRCLCRTHAALLLQSLTIFSLSLALALFTCQPWRKRFNTLRERQEAILQEKKNQSIPAQVGLAVQRVRALRRDTKAQQMEVDQRLQEMREEQGELEDLLHQLRAVVVTRHM